MFKNQIWKGRGKNLYNIGSNPHEKSHSCHACGGLGGFGGTFDGQFFVTGKLTLKNMTITNENASSDGISKKKDNAIYVQGEGEVICENVTFNIKKGTGITSWWSSASTNPDAKWNNVVVKNCVFNCNGNRPLQIEGNATIEGCTFNITDGSLYQLDGDTKTLYVNP